MADVTLEERDHWKSEHATLFHWVNATQRERAMDFFTGNEASQ